MFFLRGSRLRKQGTAYTVAIQSSIPPEIAMLKALFAVALFVVLSAPAYALPLTEADYLKSEAEHFTAADINKNGTIEKEEATAAFADAQLLPNEIARQACSKAGRDISAQLHPAAADPAYAPMTKAQFVQMRRAMFEHMDTDHDHIVTQTELDAFSNHMVSVCNAAPGMMQQMKTFQGKVNAMPPEQRAKMMEQMKKMYQPQAMPQPPAGE
jgi:hypothetical protein